MFFFVELFDYGITLSGCGGGCQIRFFLVWLGLVFFFLLNVDVGL